MISLGILVRHHRNYGGTDGEIAAEIERQTTDRPLFAGVRVPADPRERRKTFNRWEDALGRPDGIRLGAPRSEKRAAALKALRALGRVVHPDRASRAQVLCELVVQGKAMRLAVESGLWLVHQDELRRYLVVTEGRMRRVSRRQPWQPRSSSPQDG